jgi:hypothetical protein
MNFIGKITFIGEVETFTVNNNREITSREIAVVTDEQYPRTACFTLRNELAQNCDYHIGQRLCIDFDINARPNREGTRYFNQLTAWRVQSAT